MLFDCQTKYLEDDPMSSPQQHKSEPQRRETAARLHSVAIHLLRRLRTTDASLGLSPPKLSALSVLVFGGPRPLGSLAEAEGVTPSTMTTLTKSLERDGLVTRHADEHDKRSVILGATPKGARLLRRGRSERVERLMAILDDLDDAAWSSLRGVVDDLEQALHRDGKHANDS